MLEKSAAIEIKITGSKGSLKLSPETYDIRELRDVLETVEDLLYPSDKKNRPIVAYAMKEGSVLHIFRTSVQKVIEFNAVLGALTLAQNADLLDFKAGSAIEKIQKSALESAYEYEIKTSLDDTQILYITPYTHFFRSEENWVDAEFYLYGKVTNAGGKDKANIHIDTKEHGVLRVHTPIATLAEYDGNILYKPIAVRVTGKQNAETGEMDTSSLMFVEVADFDATYDEAYLGRLRERASEAWLDDIDPDQWLDEVRGRD